MLAGDATAERDARLEDLVAGRQDARRLLAVALVEEDDRMDVAVTGMKDVADAQAMARADPLDTREDLGKPRPRHDAVLRAVARRQAAHGAECALATLPQHRALRLVRGGADTAGAGIAADVDDAGRELRQAGGRAVELDQENGAGVGRKPGMIRCLDRRDDRPVHHLERGGHDAGGDDA